MNKLTGIQIQHNVTIRCNSMQRKLYESFSYKQIIKTYNVYL